MACCVLIAGVFSLLLACTRILPGTARRKKTNPLAWRPESPKNHE
jgi:hypothetical protein